MKDIKNKYRIYTVNYEATEPKYYLVSDINAIFDRMNNPYVKSLRKIEYSNLYIDDDFINDRTDKTYYMFNVQLYDSSWHDIVICKHISDIIKLCEINNGFIIYDIQEIAPIKYIKSFDEYETEMDEVRIG